MDLKSAYRNDPSSSFGKQEGRKSNVILFRRRMGFRRVIYKIRSNHIANSKCQRKSLCVLWSLTPYGSKQSKRLTQAKILRDKKMSLSRYKANAIQYLTRVTTLNEYQLSLKRADFPSNM